MRKFVALLLTLALSYAIGLFLPWWSVVIAACIVMAALGIRPLASFLIGFTAVAILWGGWASVISLANGHILAHRMSSLMIGIDNPWLLIAVTSLVGGLMGGLGGLIGALFMASREKKSIEEEYELGLPETEASSPAAEG